MQNVINKLKMSFLERYQNVTWQLIDKTKLNKVRMSRIVFSFKNQ